MDNLKTDFLNEYFSYFLEWNILILISVSQKVFFEEINYL